MGKNYNSSRLVNGLSVDASGNVGVNGTPSGSYKFEVTGNIRGTGTAYDLYTSSGIGSSAASGLLRVVTAGTSTGIAIGQANSSRYTAIQPNEHIIYNDDFFMRTNGAFPLSLGTNNAIRLSITSSGNVGIGTTSPWGKFNVVDGTNKSLVIQDAGVADTIEIINYSSSGGLRNLGIAASTLIFGTGTAGGGSAPERMRIRSNGNKTFNGPGGQDQMFSNYARTSNGEYIDIDTESGGGNFQGFLIIANSYAYNAGYRSQGTFSAIGRGTTFTLTTIASVNGPTGSSGFSVTAPSTGIIRVTNTGLYGDLIVSWRGFV
jgi:hypothetical protein